jgi:hypothetical protein
VIFLDAVEADGGGQVLQALDRCSEKASLPPRYREVTEHPQSGSVKTAAQAALGALNRT